MLQAVVDKEVQQLLVKKEAEEQLIILQQRREALHAERDDKQQQRSQLELQILRFAQKPGHSALRDSSSATQHSGHEHEGRRTSSHRLVRAAPDAGSALRSSSSQAEDKGPQCSQEQGESHGLSHEHSRHAELESDQEPESREEEEVRIQAAALDDAVDTCEAQLRYLDSAVAECKTVGDI